MCNSLWISDETCFPSSGHVTIHDTFLRSDSLILANYVRGYSGRTIEIDDQGTGWVTLSGSAGKKFRFVAFN